MYTIKTPKDDFATLPTQQRHSRTVLSRKILFPHLSPTSRRHSCIISSSLAHTPKPVHPSGVDSPPKPLETPVFTEIARRLADRVADLTHRPERALLAGNVSEVSGFLMHKFQNYTELSSSNEVSPKSCDILIGHLGFGQNPGEILTTAAPSLKPDSPILLSLLGQGSFAEIPGPPPLPDVRHLGDSPEVRALSLPVIDRDKLTLAFATPEAAQRTFKAHGWPVTDLNISKLTIEIIYIHGHTKGAHQPQPAQRGSGKVSMVKILHNNSDT
jgi:hypothetical protein